MMQGKVGDYSVIVTIIVLKHLPLRERFRKPKRAAQCQTGCESELLLGGPSCRHRPLRLPFPVNQPDHGWNFIKPLQGVRPCAGGCSSCSRNVWFGCIRQSWFWSAESFRRPRSSSSSWRSSCSELWQEFRQGPGRDSLVRMKQSSHWEGYFRSECTGPHFLFLPVKLPVLESDHVVNPCKHLFYLWMALLENPSCSTPVHIHSKVSDLFYSP